MKEIAENTAFFLTICTEKKKHFFLLIDNKSKRSKFIATMTVHVGSLRESHKRDDPTLVTARWRSTINDHLKVSTQQ